MPESEKNIGRTSEIGRGLSDESGKGRNITSKIQNQDMTEVAEVDGKPVVLVNGRLARAGNERGEEKRMQESDNYNGDQFIENI